MINESFNKMNPLSEQDLKKYHEQGWVPGPQECESSFIQRIEATQLFIAKVKRGECPLNLEGQGRSMSLHHNDPALIDTRHFFGFSPSEAVVYYLKNELPVWTGGALFIFNDENSNTPLPLICLREEFQCRDHYLSIYSKREVLAHELAHTGRIAFEEPIFEEMIAYSASESPFRRYFGPIIRHDKEIIVFAVATAFPILSIFLSLFLTVGPVFSLIFLLTPILIFSYALIRLYTAQTIFHNCLKNLRSVCGEEALARSVRYRLTDQEILLFAKSTAEKIEEYISANDSLRWKMIRATLYNRR